MSDVPPSPTPKDPALVAIGNRMRWARELIYPSQTVFANMLGIGRSTLNKIENGERAITLATLILAGNQLWTGADYLLYGDINNVHDELRKALLRLHPELLSSQPVMPTRRLRQPRHPHQAPPPLARLQGGRGSA